VKIVQAGALRRLAVLQVNGVCIPVLVPLHTFLSVVPVRTDLHGGAGAMLVEPTEGPNHLLLVSVSPQLQLVSLRRMDAKLGAPASLHPFGPRIAQKCIGQQAEVIWFSWRYSHSHTFWAKSCSVKNHRVRPRQQIRMDGAGRTGARFDG